MPRFLFLVSIFTFQIFNAQTGPISGFIRSGLIEPVAFVPVSIKGTTLTTVTDEKGAFKMNQLPFGIYTLLINPPGAKPVEHTVNLQAESGQFVEITLSPKELQLTEVTINGVRDINTRPVDIGKANIKPMDLPQSIAFIDKAVIEQQQVQQMSDALKNFNGVYIMGATGGVQQEIAARGFALSSSNTFKNGVRFNNAVLPEMSALERVEVMKGSNAILFGNVSAGGVINLVTRKPTFTNGGSLNMRFDSYGFYKPSADIYGVFDKQKRAAFRINSVYEQGRSFRENVKSERIYFNPSIAIKAGKNTDIIIEADYLKDSRTSDFGVGAINYALIDIPRSRFLGAKWSYYNTEQKSATATITHRLSKNWQVRFVSSVQTFSNDLFGTMRPNSNNRFIETSGKWIRGVQRIGISENYYLAQLDLTGEFKTGTIKHNLLAGGDADQYQSDNLAYNNINKYDSINVFDLSMYVQRSDIPSLERKTLTSTPVKRSGFYIQDLVSLTRKLKLLAGVRFSFIENYSRVYSYTDKSTVTSSKYDYAPTPRLGIVYQPLQNISVFTSYANSFTPNTGVDINGKSLAPSFITQYEGGIKTNLLNNMLCLNVTAYQINNRNLAQTSLVNGNTNTNIKELAGEVSSQGLEADIMSRSFNGLTLIAGYSYNETKYVKSNTYIEGSLLRYNPNHTANMSVFYKFSGTLNGLELGAGALYFGERQAGRSTRITVANDPYRLFTLPSYNLLEASVGYSFHHLSFRYKLSNMLNALSYNVHDDNSVNPIAPRQSALTLTYRF